MSARALIRARHARRQLVTAVGLVLALGEATAGTLPPPERLAGALPDSIPYRGCFESAARTHRLPERLLAAVAKVESAFDPRAISHKNAIGVMQIRWPVTARHLGIEQRERLFEPCISIEAGARYLREMLDEFGRLERALAAYNMGPGPVRAAPAAGLPRAGREYVELVVRALGRLDGRAGAGRGPVVAFVVPTEARAQATAAAIRQRRPDAWVRVRPVTAGWEVSVGR